MFDNKDRPHVKSGPIKYTKGYQSRRIVAKVINSMIILSIISIVIVSIMVFIKKPIKTEDGYVTADPIYEFIEHGQKVIVVNDEGFHLFKPLERFLFTQDTYLAKVIAGPYGEIEKTKGKQRVLDGTNVIGVNLNDLEKEFLDLEYVVRKIDSNGNELTNEHDLIITKERVLGDINIEE